MKVAPLAEEGAPTPFPGKPYPACGAHSKNDALAARGDHLTNTPTDHAAVQELCPCNSWTFPKSDTMLGSARSAAEKSAAGPNELVSKLAMPGPRRTKTACPNDTTRFLRAAQLLFYKKTSAKCEL